MLAITSAGIKNKTTANIFAFIQSNGETTLGKLCTIVVPEPE